MREDDPFCCAEFQVESYLVGHARRFVRSFDPNCYLYLSRASDWFDIAEYGHGSVNAALAGIRLERALVIGVSTDILFRFRNRKKWPKVFAEAAPRSNLPPSTAPRVTMRSSSTLPDLAA